MPEKTDIDAVIIKIPRWLQVLIASFALALGYQTLSLHTLQLLIPVVEEHGRELRALREEQIRFNTESYSIQELRARLASVETDIVQLRVDLAKFSRATLEASSQ